VSDVQGSGEQQNAVVTQHLTPMRRARPPRARKAAVAVAQSIVDRITDRGQVPGTKLPTEKEMVAQYGVGRGTLREALRFLELTGILEMRAGPSGGPIVAAPDGVDLAGLLGLFLQLQPTTFAAIVEARELLEPAIARVASENASASQIEALRESVARMEESLGAQDTFLTENSHFHDGVSQAAGNPLFSLLVSSLHQIIAGMPLGDTYHLERRQAVLKAHQAIFDAIADRDGDRAQQAMYQHMVEFRRYVQKVSPTVLETHLRWSDIAP
jgi:GntR family transcriptional repressor for pyruvate dehydrogenase complex